MEKMEVENNIEPSENIEVSDSEINVKTEPPKQMKWIKNQAEATKQCDACGAFMRGWAYREPFQYCPKCGALAEKAE